MDPVENSTRSARRVRPWLIFAAGTLGFLIALLLLAAPQRASAQLPPICEEYSDLPICVDDEDDGDAPVDDTEITAPLAAASAGGTLPFTGYPITWLLLLVLILLLSGLSIRGGIAVHDRIRPGDRFGDGPSA